MEQHNLEQCPFAVPICVVVSEQKEKCNKNVKRIQKHQQH